MYHMSEIYNYLVNQFSFFKNPSHGLFVGYVFIAVMIALIYGCVKNRTINIEKSCRYLFRIHFRDNISYVDDIKVFVIDKLVLGFFYTFLFGVAFFFKEKTNELMHFVGLFSTSNNVTLTTMTLYSLGAIIVFDFSTFIEHYMSHKFKFLWEFHKVHHVPQNLNPITAYRSHPVNQGLFVTISGVLTGVYSGVVSSFYPDTQLSLVFAGQNVFMFIFLMFGLNLQHSHVQIRYPIIIRDIFVSPEYHQTHHSIAEEHHDKNFGFLFSFWDRIFGTQIHLHSGKRLRFGVKGINYKEYSGVINHYVTPFVKVFYSKKHEKKKVYKSNS